MKVDIYNYLQNFENMNLPNNRGILCEDGEKIKCLDSSHLTNNEVSYYSVGDYFMYVKSLIDWKDKNSSRFISELLASRIYEKKGVNCVRTYPFIKLDNGDAVGKIISIASEDVTKIDGLHVTDNNDFISEDIYDFYKSFTNHEIPYDKYIGDEWLILTNDKLKQYMLNFMTQEAYDQLIDIMIMDTLFYINDRFGNGRNLFFVRENEYDDIKGLIPFDMESIDFDMLPVHYNNSTNKFLKDLYEDKLIFTNPHGTQNGLTYTEKLNRLKMLMNEGYFNDRQVKLIYNVLNSKITDEIEGILNKYNLDLNKKPIKIYKEIWNRNGEILHL